MANLFFLGGIPRQEILHFLLSGLLRIWMALMKKWEKYRTSIHHHQMVTTIESLVIKKNIIHVSFTAACPRISTYRAKSGYCQKNENGMTLKMFKQNGWTWNIFEKKDNAITDEDSRRYWRYVLVTYTPSNGIRFNSLFLLFEHDRRIVYERIFYICSHIVSTGNCKKPASSQVHVDLYRFENPNPNYFDIINTICFYIYTFS